MRKLVILFLILAELFPKAQAPQKNNQSHPGNETKQSQHFKFHPEIFAGSLNLVKEQQVKYNLSPFNYFSHRDEEFLGRNNLSEQNTPGSISAFGSTAAHFNASNHQALYVPSNVSLQGGATDISIVAWVKFDALGSYPQVIVAKDDNLSKRGSEYYLGYYPGHGSLVFQIEEGGHKSANDGTTWHIVSSIGKPKANKWYFVCAWYDHLNGTVNIQVDNGTIDTRSGVPPATNITNTVFTVGGVGSPNCNLAECCSFMDGAIKSVGLFKRILTTSEKNSLFNSTDKVQGTNPATVRPGAMYISDAPPALSSNKYSIAFDGRTGHVTPNQIVTLSSANSAISLWFKAQAYGGILVGYSGSAYPYIRVLDASTIRVQTDVNGTYKDFTVPPIALGTWCHLVVNRDTSGFTYVYLNGVQSKTGGLLQKGALSINQIGRYWNGSAGFYFKGLIHEVKKFDVSLSNTDITALYKAASISTTPVLHYKLNEGTGANVIDYGYVPVGTPMEYANIPLALKNESNRTFISWWDLKETSGVRHDSRIYDEGNYMTYNPSNLQKD